MNRYLLFILLLLMPFNLAAVELFGVDLNTTNREDLRAAVQENGAELISEGNDQQWFDAYDSSTLFPGSRKLYLGFVRSSGAFSFLEYEFPGVTTDRLLRRLQAKYGPADESRSGEFISDQRFLWSRNGLSIELYSDWSNYRVLLSYRNNSNLQLLLSEQREAMNNGEGVAVY